MPLFLCGSHLEEFAELELRVNVSLFLDSLRCQPQLNIRATVVPAECAKKLSTTPLTVALCSMRCGEFHAVGVGFWEIKEVRGKERTRGEYYRLYR
jgi:hypothetical protein